MSIHVLFCLKNGKCVVLRTIKRSSWDFGDLSMVVKAASQLLCFSSFQLRFLRD